MNAQELRADGWQHDAARYLAALTAVTRENRQLRQRIAELEAALNARARLSDGAGSPNEARLVSAGAQDGPTRQGAS